MACHDVIPNACKIHAIPPKYHCRPLEIPDVPLFGRKGQRSSRKPTKGSARGSPFVGKKHGLQNKKATPAAKKRRRLLEEAREEAKKEEKAGDVKEGEKKERDEEDGDEEDGDDEEGEEDDEEEDDEEDEDEEDEDEDTEDEEDDEDPRIHVTCGNAECRAKFVLASEVNKWGIFTCSSCLKQTKNVKSSWCYSATKRVAVFPVAPGTYVHIILLQFIISI